MSRTASIHRMKDHIIRAVRSKEWEAVGRAAEQLKSLLLEAVIDNAPDQVTAIRGIFADVRGELNLRNGVRIEFDPKWMSAMLLADQNTASVAARLRPRAAPAEYKAPVRTARERILLALAKAPAGALSGTELSRRTRLSERTVCLMLQELEDEGLVARERDGKARVNRLTAQGRAVLSKRCKPIRPAPNMFPAALHRVSQQERIAIVKGGEVPCPHPDSLKVFADAVADKEPLMAFYSASSATADSYRGRLAQSDLLKKFFSGPGEGRQGSGRGRRSDDPGGFENFFHPAGPIGFEFDTGALKGRPLVVDLRNSAEVHEKLPIENIQRTLSVVG